MTLVPKGEEATYSSTRVCAAQANSITGGSSSEVVPTLSEADNDDVSVWELVGPLLGKSDRGKKKTKQQTFLCDITNNILLCGWKEPYFRATETFGANSKDVSVWALGVRNRFGNDNLNRRKRFLFDNRKNLLLSVGSERVPWLNEVRHEKH